MTSWSEVVQGSYPPVTIFDDGAQIDLADLARFVRIIMTEGVPRACSQFPLAFEFSRAKAANSLGLDSKQLSLAGSARIGYSLDPEIFGRAFDISRSDFDLFAVSAELFEQIKTEFKEFIHAWETGSIAPANAAERKNWESHRRIDLNNIERGFLNTDHVPPLDQFPVSRRFARAADLFDANLKKKSGLKITKESTIRLYKDWNSAVDQISYSLKYALKKRNSAT